MATVETLKNRIESLNGRIATVQGKIRWFNNQIAKAKSQERLESLKSDLSRREKDLADLEAKKQQCRTELLALLSVRRDNPVIVKFLNVWKDNVLKFYHESAEEFTAKYPEMFKQFKAKVEEVKDAPRSVAYQAKCDFKAELLGDWKHLAEYVLKFGSLLNEFKEAPGEVKLDTEKLEKDLTREWERKYDLIIQRVHEKVGEIKNADFKIGINGELNGYITGEHGSCNVTTISAGGWNIQCAHFRVLVHAVG